MTPTSCSCSQLLFRYWPLYFITSHKPKNTSNVFPAIYTPVDGGTVRFDFLTETSAGLQLGHSSLGPSQCKQITDFSVTKTQLVIILH